MAISATARRHGPATVVLAGLIAVAWAAMVVWGRSPYAHYLRHDITPTVGALGLFVAGWTLMTIAMMLPTTMPLVRGFERLTARRQDRGRLMGLLVAGYLVCWSVFGVAAHVFDRGVHVVAGHVPQVERFIPAATLALAGAFQFTKLKYSCLDKCRSPLMMITQHWRGRAESRSAFALGVHHAAFCVGCCWAIMLLMFAVGIANVAWMFALAVVMATEKNMPWGRSIGRPVGVALVAAAIASCIAAL